MATDFRFCHSVGQWRSKTQPTNPAQPANITTSMDCQPRRARCVRCHAKSWTGSDSSEFCSIAAMDAPPITTEARLTAVN
jgi:hypothetical protein